MEVCALALLAVTTYNLDLLLIAVRILVIWGGLRIRRGHLYLQVPSRTEKHHVPSLKSGDAVSVGNVRSLQTLVLVLNWILMIVTGAPSLWLEDSHMRLECTHGCFHFT